MRAIAALIGACLIAGCSAGPTASAFAWGDRVPTPGPEAIAKQPIVAQSSDSITLRPISPRGAIVGVPYGYDMPHCGIHSPIDVDGSFWDAIRIAPDSVDFDGQPGTFRLSADNAAEFTRSDGQVLELVRHEGTKTFGYCE